jgi:PAS domain S-box-containing protein
MLFKLLKQIIAIAIFIIFCFESSFALHNNVIRVGVFDYYPSIYKDGKGGIVGYYPEAFKEIEKKEGIKIEYVYGTFNECLERLKNGKIDILPNVHFDTKLSTKFNFSQESLMTIWGEIYVSNFSKIETIDDLNNKSIACLLNDINVINTVSLLQNFNISCQLVYYNSYDEILQAVSIGKADAGLVNNIFGSIKQHDFKVRPTDIVFKPYDIYFITLKGKNNSTLDLFDSYIKKWKYDKGSIYYISRQKWLNTNINNNDYFPTWILWLLLSMSIIAAISFITVIFFRKKVKLTALQIIEKQEIIQKTELKFKTYIDHSPIGVFVIDDQGNYLSVNDAASDITGYSKEELLTMNMIAIQPPETLEEDLKGFYELRDTGKVIREFQIIRKDGNRIWAEVNGIKISDKEYFCFGFDINDRKLNEIQILNQSKEIRKQNIELQDAKAKAEESDRLKTAFLQNMSHEIRTPLNAIMGFSQILPEYFDDKESLEKFCKIILDRGEDLLIMINDVLNIAKIESGQLTISSDIFRLFDIKMQIQESFTEIIERLQKTHIKLNFECNDDLLYKTIILDAGKFKQILTNLIHNAFKFTNEGSITISCSIQKDLLCIQVKDTGIGISKEYQSEIFNRFIQVQNTGKTHIGTGLGLSIVKGLLEHMQGNISIESEPNIGTTFTISLPYKEHIEIKENKIISKNPDSIEINHLNILVIEDEETNAIYLQNLLQPHVKSIRITKDGNEALKALANLKIDVILLDIRLPEISGYEIAEKVTQLFPRISIIAQTAFASEQDRKKALDAGCHDFISKPIQREELFEKLNKIQK